MCHAHIRRGEGDICENGSGWLPLTRRDLRGRGLPRVDTASDSQGAISIAGVADGLDGSGRQRV